MDIFAISKVTTGMAQKMANKYSTFVNSETSTPMYTNNGYMMPPPPTPTNGGVTIADVLSLVLGIIIGLYAAYLSWQCNSKMNYGTFLKVIFAIFAYIFGLVYLILYLIMRYDTCRVIGKK